VRFEWDPAKERANLLKHSVAFGDACGVFADPFVLSIADAAHSDFEERWISVGAAPPAGLLVVVHTFRRQDQEEVVRIISARRATARERRLYRERVR
jgi:uncharacterized protein